MKVERDSNMEAMRAYSMLMVVLVHSVFFSVGTPTLDQTIAHPISTFFYSLPQSFAIGCVDSFILISGYFKIRVKLKSILNLLYIVYFWKIVIYLIFCIIGQLQFGFSTLVDNLKFNGPDWFISSYLGLMLFAPLLNAFIDNTSKKTLTLFVLIYLGLNVINVLKQIGPLNFNGGYSTLSFIGIYLLGALYRRYKEEHVNIKCKSGILIYIVSSVFICTIYIGWFIICHILDMQKYVGVGYVIFNYNCILTIINSLSILIIFSNLKFKSKFCNWLGASAFAVYLIHLNPNIVPYFKTSSRFIYDNSWPWLWYPSLIIWIILVYIICALCDKLRLLSWNFLIGKNDYIKNCIKHLHLSRY